MKDRSMMLQGGNSKRWIVVLGGVVLLGVAAAWYWQAKSAGSEPRKAGSAPVQVVTTQATQVSLPVKLTATGTVSALQAVDVRAQVTSTVAAVHIKEGQLVERGNLLFSLDARADEASVRKADAQLTKSRSDLANAQRNLDRQRELFNQKFISQAALEQAQTAFDVLRGQFAVDEAGADVTRVQRGYQEIRAPFSGRTGAVNVFPGTLVQPNGVAMVSISQVDPIAVTFSLPERELDALRQGLSGEGVAVAATLAEGLRVTGRLSFIDNAVDSASGTIRLKAEFPNPRSRLWPGTFVNVQLSPRTIAEAVVVPSQAVQTGPDSKFVYVADGAGKVALRPVSLVLIQDGKAAISGVKAGERVVVEGAQNLRPGVMIAEAKSGGEKPAVAGKADKLGKQQGS